MARILFFDSGIGGLSIYQASERLLPHQNYVYCLDNAFFPYSEKNEDFLIGRGVKICQQIHKQNPLDMIVIACNTASTVILPVLRQHFDIPIVGTVPAIKPAVQISQTKHLALLATKGTVNRQYTQNLIADFAKDCRVEKFGSTLLVELAEQKLHGQEVNEAQLNQHLQSLKTMDDLDTVVMGCTHFPFLEPELRQALPQVKNFVHAGNAIACRISSLLGKISQNSEGQAEKHLIATAPLSANKQQIFRQLGFDNCQVLTEVLN